MVRHSAVFTTQRWVHATNQSPESSSPAHPSSTGRGQVCLRAQVALSVSRRQQGSVGRFSRA